MNVSGAFGSKAYGTALHSRVEFKMGGLQVTLRIGGVMLQSQYIKVNAYFHARRQSLGSFAHVRCSTTLLCEFCQ